MKRSISCGPESDPVPTCGTFSSTPALDFRDLAGQHFARRTERQRAFEKTVARECGFADGMRDGMGQGLAWGVILGVFLCSLMVLVARFLGAM